MDISGFLWAVGGFFLILTPIILVHEWGHFIAARLSNIRVDEFGLGFPPRAVSLFERNGTLFSLNWIPLGGFVRPAGEDDPTVKGGLAGASKRARFFVLVAGSTVNFIFAFLVFTLMFALARPVIEIAVAEVVPNSPAEIGGLQTDDVFVSINGEEVGDNGRLLSERIRENQGQEITFVVNRNGEEVTLLATPRLPGTFDATREGALGIAMSGVETDETTRLGLLPAMGQSATTIYGFVYSTVTLPVQLLRNQIATEDARIVSVIGISQIAGQATQSSVENGRLQDVLWVMGAISVALGFTNLLPLPALDGGRILFVLIEAVRGRRIEPEREGMVHAIGMAVLLGLMVILIVQDIINPLPI